MAVQVIDVTENRKGIINGLFAYTLWGFLPLYWKLLQTVPALEVLAYRIIWSFLFLIIFTLSQAGLKKMFRSAFADLKRVFLFFLCGLVISINWLTYIYAVNADQVIETSMGYFMNPLVVVLMSVLILREQLNRWQLVAIILAACGVLIVAFQYGRIPWISLILAFSFALYGLLKKMINADALTGLTFETLVLVPLALFYIYTLEQTGSGSLSTASPLIIFFLAGTGLMTAVPMLLYARGLRKTTFSMMGFLQYIAPSITLLLGIFIFREEFTPGHLISFCFIWAALVIFTLSNRGILKEPVAGSAPGS